MWDDKIIDIKLGGSNIIMEFSNTNGAGEVSLVLGDFLGLVAGASLCLGE